MKRSLKLFTIVLLILLTVSFTVALALWFFLPREQVTAAITRELSNRLNQDITMDTFSVGFYPGVEFVTRNVRVVDPLSSREILSAQKIRFDLKLLELLNRTFVVEDITVVSPQLDLVRDASGGWNVDNLIGSVRSGEREEKTSKSVSWFEFGQVNINNGSISINDMSLDQQLDISNLNATFDIREGALSIDSASTVMPSLEAELSGTLSQLFKPGPLLDIHATVAIRKEGILAGLQSINLPAGTKIADISLDVSGSFKEIALTSTFALAPLTPAKLKTRGGITGTLQVEEGVFTVDVPNAYFGKSTLSLSGTLSNLWNKERKAVLKGTTEISLDEVNKLTTAADLADFTIRGMANASIALSASAEQVDLTTTIDLLPTDITVPQLIHKTSGAPCELSIKALYSLPDELRIDEFALVLGNDKLTGKAQLFPAEDPWLQISLTTSGFSLEHLNRVPAVKFAEGTLGLSAKVWQSNPTSEDFHYSGEGVVDGAAFIVEKMNEPFKNLSGRLEIVDNKAMLHGASFFFGESLYRLNAEVTDFSTPRITGQLRTDLLDINEIIDAFAHSKEVPEESPPSPGTPPPDFSLELHVGAEALHFGKVKTGAVSTTWKTSGRVQQFDPLHIEAFGGRLGEMFELAILEDGITWKTHLKGEKMILADITTQLFEESERVKGILSAQGKLSGRADDDPEEVWRSINGDMGFTITDSKFNQSPILKSILLATSASSMLIPGLQQISIANLLLDSLKSRGRTFDVNQVYFNTIDGTVHITDGLVHTEDSFFDGDTLDLFFKGDIDLVKENYNMKARATPMGTIGSLVGKIPVLGKQIERLRDATLSFNFTVTGPLADPKVQLNAVEKLTPKKKE
jgi:hypothetical protein